MKIPATKDFWSGLMFLAFAAVGILDARTYSIGTAGRMGPGYFPLLLGSVLGVLGAILVARSLLAGGERVDRLRLTPLAVLTIAVVLFGLMIEKLGLVVALAVVTALSALASRESRPLETVLLVAFVTVLSLGIFIYALRLPIPVWPNL